MRGTARAAVALGAVAVAVAVALEVEGRRRSVPGDWVREVHPLLGAAPRGSFAFDPDAEPWVDFAGRRFPHERGPKPRVLLVGGARAEKLRAAVEERFAGAEVVLAARDGFSVAQAQVIVGRFAPVLRASEVVVIAGDELEGASVVAGWTPEWDWQESAIESPLGELAARGSGIARLLFVSKRTRDASFEDARRRFVRGVRSVGVLARAHRVPLTWVFAAPASLAPDARDSILAEASRALSDKAKVFASPEALLSK